MIDEYPKLIDLDDTTVVRLNLVGRADETRLLLFFLTIPEEDRDFIPFDLTDPDVMQGWFGGANWAGVFPVVAELDGRIVGVAVMRTYSAAWSAHIAESWMITAPQARGRGIGRLLANEMAQLAAEIGIEQVTAHVRANNIQALQLFEAMGYHRLGLIPSYSKDADGFTHDMVILGCIIRDFVADTPDAVRAAQAQEEARMAGLVALADVQM